MRGDLEAQPASGSFAPKKRDRCVEERLLSKLSRYEATIERQTYRAQHELERLQAARRAEATLHRLWL